MWPGLSRGCQPLKYTARGGSGQKALFEHVQSIFNMARKPCTPTATILLSRGTPRKVDRLSSKSSLSKTLVLSLGSLASVFGVKFRKGLSFGNPAQVNLTRTEVGNDRDVEEF